MFEPKSFFIAGLKFHKFSSIKHLIEEGDMLKLTAEPDNEYDPNAVKISFGPEDTMLGYVPRKFSSDVAAALDIGTRLVCEVVTLNKAAKPWEKCEVEVWEMGYDSQDYDEDEDSPF